MNDLISRQAAISIPLTPKGLRKYQSCNLDDAYNEGWGDYQACVSQLPSAQPERKKGKWIKATGMMPPEFHGHHCCSECGNFANMEPPFGNREDLSKFCPNCGKRMEEDNG